ncbi:MAG: hypothetical protein ACOC5T_08145 [Elusimicrobiota bacterium]
MNQYFYNNDPGAVKAAKTATYATKNIVRAFKVFEDEQLKSDVEARKTAEKEFGKVVSSVLRPLTFRYVRQAQNQTRAYEMYNIQKQLEEDVKALEKKADVENKQEIIEELRENALERIEKLQEMEETKNNISVEKRKELDNFLDESKKEETLKQFKK